jgi:hypothetical protein
MLCKIKILKKKRNKEYGIKQRKILYGKKMLKIKCQKIKKAKKHINNGKKNRNCLFRELAKLKIKEEQIKLKKAGFREGSLDMGLNKLKKQAQEDQV